MNFMGMTKIMGKCTSLLTLPLLLLGACTTEPLLDEGLAPADTGVIAGDVLILVPTVAAHPVVLYLSRVDFDEQGNPQISLANISVVPADEMSQGDDEGVARTGEYVFSQVEPGYYVLTGIVDVDENFNPLLPTAEANPNPDLEGGYANLTTGDPIFEIQPGQIADEINVIFSVPATLPDAPTATPPPATPELPTPTVAPTPELPSPTAAPTPDLETPTLPVDETPVPTEAPTSTAEPTPEPGTPTP